MSILRVLVFAVLAAAFPEVRVKVQNQTTKAPISNVLIEIEEPTPSDRGDPDDPTDDVYKTLFKGKTKADGIARTTKVDQALGEVRVWYTVPDREPKRRLREHCSLRDDPILIEWEPE